MKTDVQTVTLITCLTVAALAVWEVLEIWLRGSLFATWRARVECWTDWRGELLRCELCLAPWVSLVLVLWLGLSETLIGDPGRPSLWRFAAEAPLYALAVARVANVFSRLTRPAGDPTWLPPAGDDDDGDVGGTVQVDADAKDSNKVI